MFNTYNLIKRSNIGIKIYAPMLGCHPIDWPKFRDCFRTTWQIPQYDDHIIIVTRTGIEKQFTKENSVIRDHPYFLVKEKFSIKSPFEERIFIDPTYAFWVFEVPEEWRNDYNIIKSKGIGNASQKYKDYVADMFIDRYKMGFMTMLESELGRE